MQQSVFLLLFNIVIRANKITWQAGGAIFSYPPLIQMDQVWIGRSRGFNVIRRVKKCVFELCKLDWLWEWKPFSSSSIIILAFVVLNKMSSQLVDELP